jgi:hypothetical protein
VKYSSYTNPYTIPIIKVINVMRLLNSRTKILEDFDRNIPPYAILSHTWEREEVSFSTLKDDNIDHTTRQGWHKIEMSCEQALRDGLDYIWVDTVCIDKSSSAELSEAINSMFKWYRDSFICYGYLYDLPAVSFENSRWFTRGWTLQEMIAPKLFKFYDKDWNFQGSKSDLVHQLNNITGVDVTILQGGSLRLTSVARKMSWAAKRQTARIEDMAYCLLGLFDLSMPMLYGEGSKAFIRLQEEIVKEYDDQSLFAWKSDTANESAGIFAESPADFAASANIGSSIGHSGEPAMVTSRGIRISAFLTHMDANNPDNTMFLAVLNCRSLDFDMERGKRIAIALGKCREDVHPTWIRLRPSELFSNHTIREERQTLYVLKDNHIEYMSGSPIFWVRSMPTGRSSHQFELIIAHPREQWDEKERFFRANLTKKPVVTQLLLVFRYANCGRDSGHFLVHFGFDTGHHKINQWCNITFDPRIDPTHLDMDRIIQDTDKYREHITQGAGVTLKCHMSFIAVSGQQVHAVDLYTNM